MLNNVTGNFLGIVAPGITVTSAATYWPKWHLRASCLFRASSLLLQ